jgi:hypothetical protein
MESSDTAMRLANRCGMESRADARRDLIRWIEVQRPPTEFQQRLRSLVEHEVPYYRQYDGIAAYQPVRQTGTSSTDDRRGGGAATGDRRAGPSPPLDAAAGGLITWRPSVDSPIEQAGDCSFLTR